MLPIKVFASHDWGVEAHNHKRVAVVVDALKKKGVNVWFDETHMKGNILDAMCKGIDTSDVVLVFVTDRYIRKVETGNDNDNVRREFMYAKDYPDKMIAIRFDDSLPSKWSGPVGMVLGSRLYVDLSRDGPPNVEPLLQAIRQCSPRTMWKTAVKKVHVTTPTLRRPQTALISSAVQGRPAVTLAVTPAVTPAGAKKEGVRGRVARILKEMGDSMHEGEHVGAAVDRLLMSIAGEEGADAPLCDKLAMVEAQLGIAAKA